MFGRCDVWGWKGHIWETPKHNKALGNIDVIDKCRCGNTRSRTVFVPLPDMEPVEQENIETDIGFNIGEAVGYILMIVIMLTILPMIVDMMNGSFCTGNATRC